MYRSRRRMRVLLAVGMPSLAVAGVAAWAGMSLIAPGTTIAGQDVGFMLPSAAAERVNEHLASTEISVTVDGESALVKGSALGASTDAEALAAQALTDRPLWNIGAWSGEEIRPDIAYHDATTNETLREAFPNQSSDPEDATIEFSDGEFLVIEATEGQGVNPDSVEAAFNAALYEATEPVEASVVTHEADISTASAIETANQLNTLKSEAGFYSGEERTLAIEPEVFASWVEFTPNPEAGKIEFTIAADAAAIDPLVQQLPDLVYQEPVDGTAIVNSNGDVLDELEPTIDGTSLDSTEGIADAFVAQLLEQDVTFTLEPTVVEAQTATIEYTLEVDLSEQMLYVKENGVVVDSWLVSTGTDATPTTLGHYSIGWRTPIQTMYGDDYVQPDVKWPMYFNGDEAFHGVYWHSNWGTPMSHGCVGMPDDRAKQIYDWAPEGTDVIIRA
ncbi:L,D-transpeptidase family protein [Gulosibacter chungangensis]|uniref:L,D-transpeptidase family protein n=1 Tax=Gulosibacter chungangensis TaxID=979746 RepID=UPI0017882061|nr:L,D-transpeptidase family protein [Gulosibacter chungangensis]